MFVSKELYKEVNAISFSLLSPNEVRKKSVVEVQTADTYDEDGVPISSGLMDGRLGTLEPRQKCKSCGNTAVNCPGHYGHIELAEPVIHVAFVKVLYRLLTATCRNCGRVRLPESRISFYLNEIEHKREILNTILDSIYDLIFKEAKKAKDCSHCGAEQYDIEFMKPTTFHELREGGAVRLTPGALRERLERISDEDLTLFGINSEAARPEWIVLQALPVPPVTVRPSITLESGVRSEDDLTHKLVDIIRINQKLKEALDSGVPVNIIQELHDLLQYHITTYFDNEVSGIPPARHRSGRTLKTLSQRLKGKEGRFRGNLSGKRVDFSARTVISPDPNLELDEVGVPIDIVSKLTVPVKVTPWNLEELRELVRNGPDMYPGALYIIRPDNRRLRLEFVTGREELVEALQPGFIVERHLKDGDIVLFNRQPSLHRMSIMAHKIKVLPFKTFRLNSCVCPSYNADFDGDEMNLHAPQSEEARTEARLLMQVQDQILSPRYGGPIIGAIRDHLTASYLLTHQSTYLTKNEMGRFLIAARYEGDIPEPIVKTPIPLWSGKQIFSLFIPKDLNFVSKSSICSLYKCENCLKEKCQYDAYVVIKNGQLRSGIIDKATIGAEKSESLLHRIVKDYGSEFGKQFLDSISRLFDRFITLRGFTYSLDELDIPKQAKDGIQQTTDKAEENVNNLIEKFWTGKLDRLPGQTLEESLEIYIMNELAKARDKASEHVEHHFTLENPGIIMAATGARGSMLNMGQMSGCLGQQSIRGKRISRGYRGRTLPFFTPGDAGAPARGFVYNCYRDGLNPIEFFFHAMGGREGLVDTAVRTQQSGYMQRRLINALEHLRVEYDGTVRDSGGNILQFRYGEDGVDAAKSDHGKAVNIKNIISRVKLKQEGGKPTPSRHIDKRVKEISPQLTPMLYKNLLTSLKEEKLNRNAVDEIINLTLKSYRQAQIEPGEAAGIISAQSIGEPGTQMTLRTFHYAGVRERNVTLGLPRLIEIVDARRTPSTPSMIVYLDSKHRHDRKLAEDVANAITHTTIQDVADLIESIIIDMKVKVYINPEAMAQRKILLEDVEIALKLPKCEINSKDNVITVNVKGRNIPQFKRLANRIPDLKVKGIKAVKRALIREESEEWIIETDGSSLKSVMEIPGVDTTRTISNNIHEVAEVLGIEAARNVIIKEALEVLQEQGLDVDVRHVMLAADAMTSSGEVQQVGRHGISGLKTSTLARAAFEITVPTLVEASLKGDSDELRGVAENVIVGQQIPMGTGLVEIFMAIPGKNEN